MAIEKIAQVDVESLDDVKADAKEGGIEGWLTVLGSFLVYYTSFGIINSFGFFHEIYQREFLPTTPSSTIALIGALQIGLMNLLASLSGALYDCYGFKVGFLQSGHDLG